MNSPTYRFVVFSAEAHQKTWAEMRQQRVDQPLAVQLGKIGLYKMSGSYIVNTLEDYFDGELIGSGGEQVALRTADREPSVVKILIKSMGLKKGAAEKLRAAHQKTWDECQDYLGDHWTETTFYTSSLPRVLGGRAVLAVQPLVEPVWTFESAADVPAFNAERAYRTQVNGLAERLTELHSDRHQTPDLLGDGNIIIAPSGADGQKVGFLDTIAVTQDKLAEPYLNGLTREQATLQIIKSWHGEASPARELSESQIVTFH